MKQIYLNLWKDDYESEFIIGDSNINAKEIICNINSNILLFGPNFCGKKHLLYQISKMKSLNIYFLDRMKDEEIIFAFDKFQGIWVQGYVKNFSNDVRSRIASMVKAEIFELTPDMLFPLLMQRLERVGLVLRKEVFNYILYRMPLKYEFIENMIKYLLGMQLINLNTIKIMFQKLDP